MCNFLELWCAMRNAGAGAGAGAGKFERRGRKGFAENAKNTDRKVSQKLKSKFGIFLVFLLRPLRNLCVLCVQKAPAFLAVALVGLSTQSAAQNKYGSIGRSATPAEVQAWDIDVRPDFKGLPKGQGSVKAGEQVWEEKCASCHGSFGESNEVFPPMVGYTTAQDVKTGRAASLRLGADAPTRTTMMKLSQLSTLWDYIHRAMPWTAPKSLSANDVYAVTAYILNMANVVGSDFVLSDANMAATQALLPNRNGMTTEHALWPGKELAGRAARPDVQGSTCMQDCKTGVAVASSIPAYARNQSGNLAEQMRAWGPLPGVNTSKTQFSEQKAAEVGVVPSFVAIKNVANEVKPPVATNLKYADVADLLQRNTCSACHGQSTRLVGPSFAEIAARHSARADALAYLQSKINAGGQGVWGAIPMPPQSIDEPSARKIAQWLAQGAAR